MFARTERLLLRPGWIEDAPALDKALAHGNFAPKLVSAPWPYAIDDVIGYLGRDRKVDEADLLIFQRTMTAPRLIGGISLATRDSDLELGYWIVPSHWGLGFATEAGQAVIAMARDTLRIDQLISKHAIDNPAAGRVLDKLGFTAVRRDARPIALHDVTPTVTMAIDLHPMALAA